MKLLLQDIFNYDVDSDEEWIDEPGESLSGDDVSIDIFLYLNFFINPFSLSGVTKTTIFVQNFLEKWHKFDVKTPFPPPPVLWAMLVLVNNSKSTLHQGGREISFEKWFFQNIFTTDCQNFSKHQVSYQKLKGYTP